MPSVFPIYVLHSSQESTSSGDCQRMAEPPGGGQIQPNTAQTAASSVGRHLLARANNRRRWANGSCSSQLLADDNDTERDAGHPSIMTMCSARRSRASCAHPSTRPPAAPRTHPACPAPALSSVQNLNIQKILSTTPTCCRTKSLSRSLTPATRSRLLSSTSSSRCHTCHRPLSHP
jgi:hypothetical protein